MRSLASRLCTITRPVRGQEQTAAILLVKPVESRPKPEVVRFEVELVRDGFFFVHWNPGTFSGHEARFVVVARVDWLLSL